MLPEIGTIVAEKYEIVDRIGAGAMGSVFKATHRAMNRVVALKFVHAGIEDKESMERFKREAKILSTLKHKNVVSCYELGLWQGHAFAAMEYVEGESLNVLLHEQETLSVRRAIEIAAQIADGLACAHKNGVVHRDLKPSNILMVGDTAKIIDFGLAKVHLPVGVSMMKLTETGFAVGTPQYMSPEQCVGQNVDARSDIYALGVLMFQMITGKPPFVADSPIEVMHQHFAVIPPPVSVAAPDVVLPSGLDIVVARALAKDPADRYQSAEDFLHALHLVAEGQGGKVTQYIPSQISSAAELRSTPPKRLGTAILVGVLLGGGCLVIGGGYWYFSQNSGDSLEHALTEYSQGHPAEAEEIALSVGIAKYAARDLEAARRAFTDAEKYSRDRGAVGGALVKVLAAHGSNGAKCEDMRRLLDEMGAREVKSRWGKADADMLKFIADDLALQLGEGGQFAKISRFDITRLKSGDSLCLYSAFRQAHNFYEEAAASKIPSIRIRGQLGLARVALSEGNRFTVDDLPPEQDVKALNDGNVEASYYSMKWRLDNGAPYLMAVTHAGPRELGIKLTDRAGHLTPEATFDLMNFLRFKNIAIVPPSKRVVTGTDDWLEFWREYLQETALPDRFFES